MSLPEEFRIENSILKKYTGPGGNVVIPDGVRSISHAAFFCQRNVRSVTLPDSVAVICSEAFHHCTGLQQIRFPKRLRRIGRAAFRGCTSLQVANIPEGVTEIRPATFQCCRNLQAVILPDTVKKIGKDAFWGCSSLWGITLPQQLEEIGPGAFQSCSKMSAIKIPDSTIRIGDRAFRLCSGLRHFCIGKNHPVFAASGRCVFSRDGTVLYWCSPEAKGEYTVPEGVRKIAPEAFRDCRELFCVHLPDSLEEIGPEAFRGCTFLQNIRIPPRVTEIGAETFSGCFFLGEVTPCSRLTCSTSAFYNAPSVWFSRPWGMPWGKIRNRSVLFFCTSALAGEAGPEEACWKEYLRRQRKQFYDLALEKEPVLQYLAENDLIGLKDLDALLKKAPASARAVLLEYQRRHSVSARKLRERRQAQELAASLTGSCTVSLARQDWSFEYLEDSSIRIRGYRGRDTAVVFPTRIGRRKITEIGARAFSPTAPRISEEVREMRRSITDVSLPESVTCIGREAFAECISLREIILPPGVTEIGPDAFRGCRGLTLCAPAGSAAEAFAKEAGIAFAEKPAGTRMIP